MEYRFFSLRPSRGNPRTNHGALPGVSVLFVITSFLVASCAPAVRSVAAEVVPTVTATPPVVWKTPELQPEGGTVSTPPMPTATLVLCDPYVEEYCIIDGHFIFRRPILPPGRTSVDVSYPYGSTQDGQREPHHGVEFLNTSGTPVHAAGNGVIQFAGPDREASYSPWKNFYGNMIVIRHAGEMYTLYAHLSEVFVAAGDEVRAGDLIGAVGNSGAATGSHLHFEVRRGGDGTDYFATVNPELWLIPERDERGVYYSMIMISVEDQNGKHRSAELTLTRFSSVSGKAEKTYFLKTYVDEMALGDENAVMSRLPAGRYRIALTVNGHLYERWVELRWSKLTQVVLIVK